MLPHIFHSFPYLARSLPSILSVPSKVRTDTTILVRRPYAEPNWLVHEVWQDTLCRYVKTFRLGPIQQFWFAEPDTEPIGVVRLVRHDTLQRYVLTLVPFLLPSFFLAFFSFLRSLGRSGRFLLLPLQLLLLRSVSKVFRKVAEKKEVQGNFVQLQNLKLQYINIASS